MNKDETDRKEWNTVDVPTVSGGLIQYLKRYVVMSNAWRTGIYAVRRYPSRKARDC